MKRIKVILKAGLFFGLAMSFFLSSFFAIVRGSTEGVYGIIIGIIEGLALGAFAGLLFGLAIGFIVDRQAKAFEQIKKELSVRYNIIYDSAANHFLYKEGVGGWLILTTEGILFKSHGYNIQDHTILIYLGEIKTVTTYRNFGFIHNGLCIERKNGQIDKFSVDHVKIWVSKINAILDFS